MEATASVEEYRYDSELLEEAKKKGRQKEIYRFPDKAVVCGPSANLRGELHLDTIKKDNVSILRRKGGGCSVVLDRGSLIVSVAKNVPGTGKLGHFFDKFSDCIVDAFKKSGLTEVSRKGTSDIAINNKKIAGSCIYRSRGLVYFSASILVETDISLMSRYLKHPPREPDYRDGRTHRDFVTSIKEIRPEFRESDFTETLRRKLLSNKF